jgi:hypothetical protein
MEGLCIETKSMGVFRDADSAFLALIKKGIEDEYILKEIFVSNDTPNVSFNDALDSLGGIPQTVGDVYQEKNRMRRENEDRQTELYRSLDTTEKFASFLYEKYISGKGGLEDMNNGLERLGWDCATNQYVENFRGCVCANQFQ